MNNSISILRLVSSFKLDFDFKNLVCIYFVKVLEDLFNIYKYYKL